MNPVNKYAISKSQEYWNNCLSFRKGIRELYEQMNDNQSFKARLSEDAVDSLGIGAIDNADIDCFSLAYKRKRDNHPSQSAFYFLNMDIEENLYIADIYIPIDQDHIDIIEFDMEGA
jgi:Arc/MetJ-type ribon-helix-helix transcriptional regulator